MIPLDLHINVFDDNFDDAVPPEKLIELTVMVSNLLQIVAPHRTRIRRFSGTFPQNILGNIGIHDMTNLRSLTIHSLIDDSGDEDDDTVPENEILDIGSPRETLKSLIIGGCAINIESILPHTQLTHVELLDIRNWDDLSQQSVFHLMNSLPKLKKLYLSLSIQEADGWNGPSERIVLPELQLLFLTWIAPTNIDTLLKSISAPSLRKLALWGTPIVNQEPWDVVYDFIAASRPALAYLALGEFNDVSARYHDILDFCPDVKYLALEQITLSDAFFWRLAHRNEQGEPDIAHTLETIVIDNCTGFNVSSLCGFLQSHSSVLNRVTIAECPSLDESSVKELKNIGLKNLIVRPCINGDAQPESNAELVSR
jgi:hypothetical protein